MKYTISFQGWDTEVLVDKVSEKMFNHFKENGLNVTDHMCGDMEDELSDEITDGVCCDSKFECDRLYHDFGPNFNGGVTIHVINTETDQEVYSSDLNEYRGGTECEQEVFWENFGHRYVLVGQIYSKGYSAEYVLDLQNDEEFDYTKLTLLYNDIDEHFQIVTGVRYNDVDLECTGELDTKGKGEKWFIIDIETGEQTVED